MPAEEKEEEDGGTPGGSVRCGRSRSRCTGCAFPRAPLAEVTPRYPRVQRRTVSGRGRHRATGARYRRGRAGGAARAGPPDRDRAGTPPGPLPAPLTAAPFPGSAAATPPRPPRRARARERRWAPCAGVSPGPRCCRRWAAGWRRRPAPPSPRLPGWCSPSRRAARAAAMSPSPPGKGGTGSGVVMPAPVAPRTGHRAGHGWRGRSRVQHRRPDSGTGAEHPLGWGQTPLSPASLLQPRDVHSDRCLSLSPPQRSCPPLSPPHCPHHPHPCHPHPPCSHHPSLHHSLSSSSSSPPCSHPVAQPEPPQGWPGPARGDLGPSRGGSAPAVLLQGYFWAIPPVPCLSQCGLWG